MVWVAPSRRAIASLLWKVSTAIIFSAPAIRAPWTADSPIPPHPNTATEVPGLTCVWFRTEPGSRGHGASYERRSVHRQVVRNLNEAVFVTQYLFRERTTVGDWRDLLAAPCGARLFIVSAPDGFAIHAETGIARNALVALAAVDDRKRDHVIAWFDVADQTAHFLNNAGGFMAEQGRYLHRDQPFDVVQVAVAYAAGRDLDQHLVVLRLVDVYIVYEQRLMGGPEIEQPSSLPFS
jgi:hypothetical protein